VSSRGSVVAMFGVVGLVVSIAVYRGCSQANPSGSPRPSSSSLEHSPPPRDTTPMSVAKSDDLRALPPKAPPETSATPTMIHRTDQATPESTVSLVGVVRLTATPSAPATQSLVGAPSCFSRHPEGRPDDSLLVEDDLGLQNAVVWVLLGTPPAREAVSRPDSISFEDCRFHPRVVALVPEQSLRCRNDDDLRHDLLGGTEGPTPLEPGQSIRMRWSGPCDPLPQSCGYILGRSDGSSSCRPAFTTSPASAASFGSTASRLGNTASSYGTSAAKSFAGLLMCPKPA